MSMQPLHIGQYPQVRYCDELAAVLAELAPPCLHILAGGVNTDRWAGGAGREGWQCHQPSELMSCKGELSVSLTCFWAAHPATAPCPPLPHLCSGLPMPAITFEGVEHFKLESSSLHPVRGGLAAVAVGHREASKKVRSLGVPVQLAGVRCCPNRAAEFHSTELDDAVAHTHVPQVLSGCRAIKTAMELEIMRYACKVASAAHVAVMQVRSAQP